jgi:hypothetical protein
MYIRLFTSIFSGSLYGKFEPTVTFIAMLALADRAGEVDMIPEAIASKSGFPLDIILAGIAELEEPDPRSRIETAEGRRILRIDEHRDWGWKITNFAEYQKIRSSEERREYFREYKAAKRAAARGNVDNSGQKHSPPVSTPLDANSTSISKSKNKILRPQEAAHSAELAAIRSIFPKRSGSQPWTRAERAIHARLADGGSWHEFLEGTNRYAEFCRITGKVGTEFVMQAATFFGPERRYLEAWSPPITKADNRLTANLCAAEEFMRRTDHATN